MRVVHLGRSNCHAKSGHHAISGRGSRSDGTSDRIEVPRDADGALLSLSLYLSFSLSLTHSFFLAFSLARARSHSLSISLARFLSLSLSLSLFLPLSLSLSRSLALSLALSLSSGGGQPYVSKRRGSLLKRMHVAPWGAQRLRENLADL